MLVVHSEYGTPDFSELSFVQFFNPYNGVMTVANMYRRNVTTTTGTTVTTQAMTQSTGAVTGTTGTPPVSIL
uniref:Uncharacterized protein n=1 Tax=Acrobeloides nanus TaxID=290746 RepID=A0A914DKW2_9BILA